MTLIGDPNTFAIESQISRVYTNPAQRALGYFVLHLGGKSYGVRAPDATLLACSVDAVVARLRRRGAHTVPGVVQSAEELAATFLRGRYPTVTERAESSDEELATALVSQGCEWAPDGDEAFDDGSIVLQFDFGDQVRLVGFRRSPGASPVQALSDVWLPADDFYRVLQRWSFAFESEWQSLISSIGEH